VQTRDGDRVAHNQMSEVSQTRERGKMTMYSVLHVVKTSQMLSAHRTDYLPTPIEI